MGNSIHLELCMVAVLVLTFKPTKLSPPFGQKLEPKANSSLKILNHDAPEGFCVLGITQNRILQSDMSQQQNMSQL